MRKTLALALLIALFALTSVQAQQAGGAGLIPDHVTLTWSADPATTMTITWRTDTTVAAAFVQYGQGASLTRSARQAKATRTVFATDLGDSLLFRATLSGLKANEQYSYRVGDGTHWSETHHFRTADPKTRAFKFLVFGDSQCPKMEYSTWGDTVRNAFKANPDARFFVSVGDLVDIGQSGAHWNGWFAGAAGVIDTIPEMAVVGNHETTGSKSTRRPAYFDAQFAYPPNGPDGLKDQVYSYNYGPVHFSVLDSQQTEEKRYGDIYTPQQKWLDADLKASHAPWKIAFFHKGPYEIHMTRTSNDVKAAFCPTLERDHVDLVFNGHDHGVGRTYPIKNGVCGQKPSQGTIYYITGHSGSKFYTVLEKKPWDAYFYNPLAKPNYLVVEVTPGKLTVKNVNQDGKVLDTFYIDKKNDVDSDCLPQHAGK